MQKRYSPTQPKHLGGKVRAKKSLGQHFLKDLSIAKQIADTVDSFVYLTETDCVDNCFKNVLEIGPGMGVLTQFLLEKEKLNLTTVELDTESVDYLLLHFPKLHIINADFLKLDLKNIYKDEPFAVIGNYPYNISSQIFFKILEYKNQIPFVSGMLQKEVAERLAAKPGNKSYGILSVLLQAYYDIEYLFTVDRHVFNPPPKVQSAVIQLKRNNREKLSCDEQLFKQVVKTAFNQRRKQMRNSLALLIQDKQLLQNDIFTKRPEQLSVSEFEQLTNLVSSQQV